MNDSPQELRDGVACRAGLHVLATDAAILVRCTGTFDPSLLPGFEVALQHAPSTDGKLDDRDVIVEKVLQELPRLVGELPTGFTSSDVVGRGSWHRGHWALRFTGPRRLA